MGGAGWAYGSRGSPSTQRLGTSSAGCAYRREKTRVKAQAAGILRQLAPRLKIWGRIGRLRRPHPTKGPQSTSHASGGNLSQILRSSSASTDRQQDGVAGDVTDGTTSKLCEWTIELALDFKQIAKGHAD
jgi:hypothetical protein